MKTRFPILTLLCGVLLGSFLATWWTWGDGASLGLAPAHALEDQQKGRDDSRFDHASPLHDGSRLLSKVAQHVTPSVVHIQSKRLVQGGTIEETGSGVLIKNDRVHGTYVVTNRHVILDAKLANISIHLYDGRVVYPERLWTDKATDLAVLKIEADEVQPATWGDSQRLEIGHIVLAMGSPFGLSQSITFGIISAKGRRSLKLGEGTEVLNQDFLQTDAAINPGNSGGPLIDLNGEVIGINTAIASNSGGNDGIGFSIPSHLARRVVDQLLYEGKVTRAYLGVKLDPEFSVETAGKLKLDRIRGARVTEVYPQTPASRADLRINDVILNFDGTDVQDENHLINLVSLTPVEKMVRLQVWREGKRLSMEVTLGDREDLERRSISQSQNELPADSMGFGVERLDGELAAQLGFRSLKQGLMITHVAEAGALSGEVQPGDVLCEVAGEPVRSLEELAKIVERHESSARLVLKLHRRSNGTESERIVIWNRAK